MIIGRFLLSLGLILAPSAFALSSSEVPHFQIFPDSMAEPEGLPEAPRKVWSNSSLTPNGSPDSFSLTQCQAEVKNKICFIRKGSRAQAPHCLPTDKDFSKSLIEVLPNLPNVVQKTFCNLSVIYVEDQMEALGYAGLTESSDKALMGFNRAVLEGNLNPSEVFTWKEQKVFGVVTAPFIKAPGTPKIEVQMTGSNPTLQYIIIHEVGHIVDFLNKANKTNAMDEPVSNSWGSLSFDSRQRPKARAIAPLIDKLCFYYCRPNQGLTLVEKEEFYHQMNRTDFATTYASVNPFEDFAESFAFYLLKSDPAFKYTLETDEMVYLFHVKWPQLIKKNNWLEAFFDKGIIYPSK